MGQVRLSAAPAFSFTVRTPRLLYIYAQVTRMANKYDKHNYMTKPIIIITECSH